MLNGISNIVKVLQSGEVKLQAFKVPKTLPKVNSFVKIEVLDVVKGNAKILINGNLFQSKLPVKTHAGDMLFAQVISQNPLTLSLDAFVASKLGESGLATAILSKLGLPKTKFSANVLEALLKSKKPVSREKTKQLLEFVDSLETLPDKIQMAFLIAYFWDDSGETFSQKRSVYRRVFDLSFNELTEAIYKKIVWLSGQNLEMKLYGEIKKKLIFDHKNFEQTKSANALFGKVKNAIELADFLDKYSNSGVLTSAARTEIAKLKEYLIKYVLQKSLLSKYELYPDFAITLADEGLHLWRFEFAKAVNSNGEAVYKLESSVLTRSEKLIDYKIFISEKKVQGDVKAERMPTIAESVNRLNGIFTRKFAIDSNIRFAQGSSFVS